MEMDRCRSYLYHEMNGLDQMEGMVAMGDMWFFLVKEIYILALYSLFSKDIIIYVRSWVFRSWSLIDVMTIPRSMQALISQLRSGILPIEVETGRFSNSKFENRLCKLCPENSV